MPPFQVPVSLPYLISCFSIVFITLWHTAFAHFPGLFVHYGILSIWNRVCLGLDTQRYLLSKWINDHYHYLIWLENSEVELCHLPSPDLEISLWDPETLFLPLWGFSPWFIWIAEKYCAAMRKANLSLEFFDQMPKGGEQPTGSSFFFLPPLHAW